VKGSGGDLGTLTRGGLAALRMDRLLALRGLYRGHAQEDGMVALYAHCTFGVDGRAPSIDTPLHALFPARHVDHMHPDAVIAIAAARDGPALTRDIFRGRLGWIDWLRPGFELGLRIAAMARDNPALQGIVLGGHGVISWAEDSEACYRLSLDIIETAGRFIAARASGRTVFGGVAVPPCAADLRRRVVAAAAPVLRGLASRQGRKLGHFVDSPEVLDFVGGQDCARLAALVPHDAGDVDLDRLIEGYRANYAAYYERCKHADSPPLRDPNAVIYLVPRVGMLSFAKDKATARIAAEFYVNAINVMRGASGVSAYKGLPEQEAFNIEYWLLEEAKLARMPKPKSLAGRIAFITGGAGGIGSAIAAKLLSEGACVALADIDQASLDEVTAGFGRTYGKDNVRGIRMDVTSEPDVISAMNETALAFGGVDIIVNNAGITVSAPVEETTLELWNKNQQVMGAGYFLVGREGYRLLKRQALGGSMVFICSKNAVAASPGASAYCAVKASELHLARCMALEGAPHGIRVNAVNPDAVLRGSKIWQGPWRQQRAASLKITEDELEEHCRKRSLLQRSVYPEDIAEGVYFFASDLSSKSTGNFLNVDAGNAASFTR